MKPPRVIVARRTPDLVEAMNSPQLFQPWFRGESWDGWRSVLKATAALPMTTEEIDFFKSVAGGREPPRGRPRESWFICGRRAGKDSVVSLIAAHAAASFNPRGILRPGERAVVACIAPNRETGKIVQNYIAAYFQTIPSLRAMVQRETEELLELKNSVDISVMTNNYRLLRGRPILCGVLDEIAFAGSEESSRPDFETYAAIVPGMATIPQAQLFGISSPHAKGGLLYKKFTDNFGKDSDDIIVIQAPSATMNPALDLSDRNRMMVEDPDRARAEWDAQFRSDLVAFIDSVVVSRCVVRERAELLPVPGIKYIAAVDPSGGSSDSMTIAISHAEGDRAVLDLVREWRAPFSPESVAIEAVETLKRFGIKSVTGDAYAGQWAREPFRLRGIEYEVSALTRSEAYLALLPQINSGKVELLDHQRLIAQLCSLERRVARSGRDQVDHPRGGHDDVINAAALALVGVAQPKSSAANWLEYMRREAVRAGIERDDIRPPAFGFSFDTTKTPEPLLKVIVPIAIAGGGGNTVTIEGQRYSWTRWEEGRAYIQLPRDHARQLLQHEAWRADNGALAHELVGGGAA